MLELCRSSGAHCDAPGSVFGTGLSDPTKRRASINTPQPGRSPLVALTVIDRFWTGPRCSQRRWQSHPLAAVMQSVVKHIQKHLPRTVILENVVGIADKMDDEERSALDLLVAALMTASYSTIVFEMGPEAFVEMHRERMHVT